MLQICALAATLIALPLDISAGFLSGDAGMTAPDPAYMHPIELGGRWGYIGGSGKVVIKPVFEAAAHFAEGLAPVKIGGLCGYIGLAGAVEIPPQYDEARFFYKGIAPICKGNGWGYINHREKLLSPLGLRLPVAFRTK